MNTSDHLKLSSPKSPRTPTRRSPKKKSPSKGGGRGDSQRKLPPMSPTFTPKGWETKKSFLVYEKPKDETKQVANIAGRNQGIWTKGYVAAQNPQELWVFDRVDAPTDFSSHIHGVWGYKPGGDPEDPNDVWFYPPNFNDDYSGKDAEKLPSYFTQRGVWTYPLVKRDVSEIAPRATGWLGLSETVKMEKLDVAGTWKMLYKQGAKEGDDTPKGPGMKSRSPTKFKTPSPQKKKKAISHMNITVEVPDGKEITMKVLPTDTVGDIHAEVESQLGIPQSAQRLLSPHGDLLEDPKYSLESHNIRNGNTLRLEGMRVSVENKSGNDRADDVFIIDNLTPGTTVTELKTRIEDQEGIDADDQLLTLRRKLLDDHKTLEDYGVKHEEVFQLRAMSIQVRDSSSEKLYTLDNGLVCPSSTIDEIKMLLNDVHNLPPPEYLRLSYEGTLLEKDCNTLKDYDIPHKAILELEPMSLTVQTPEGTFISLQVHPMDTIQGVKELVEGEENIPVDNQRLSFDGTMLKNSKTLVDYGIQHDDTLVLGGMQIHVNHYNGNSLTLDVAATSTISEVKETIRGEEGTPIEEQFLSFGPKSLKEDDRTLASYKIKHGSTLKLEKMKIYIQGPDGKFPLHVSPTTPMEELKRMIEKKTSIAPNNQFIKFQDANVGKDDGATINDCGIQHRDTLHVAGAVDDPTYMVEVSDYKDAFTYVPSPNKSKFPRSGRKVARNKAASFGGTSFGNFLETTKMADREAGRWTHTVTES